MKTSESHPLALRNPGCCHAISAILPIFVAPAPPLLATLLPARTPHRFPHGAFFRSCQPPFHHRVDSKRAATPPSSARFGHLHPSCTSAVTTSSHRIIPRLRRLDEHPVPVYQRIVLYRTNPSKPSDRLDIVALPHPVCVTTFISPHLATVPACVERRRHEFTRGSQRAMPRSTISTVSPRLLLLNPLTALDQLVRRVDPRKAGFVDAVFACLRGRAVGPVDAGVTVSWVV